MDYQRFLQGLPDLYEDWGTGLVRPKSSQFQKVLDQIQGMTTAGVMQLLNWAVACMEPDELYCEIGTYRGSTLVGALLNQGDRLAYAVDNFSEFDDGQTFAALLDNLSHFNLEDQVYFCNQDFQEFLLQLKEIETNNNIGVYFYDGAHDYRSTLMGLLLVRPFLADRALIILDDANWKTVQQAIWDFIATSPEATVLLELATPVARHESFWNGIWVLGWQQKGQHSYSSDDFKQNRQSSVIQAIYNVQILEQRSESLDLLYQEARDCQQQGQFAVAEKKYQAYLLWQDNHGEAWHDLGLLYCLTGETGGESNYQNGILALRKALDLGLKTASVYYHLGYALQQLGESNQAILAYRAAISLEPTFVNALINLGYLLCQRYDFAQAEDCYRRAIAISPQEVGGYLSLGNLFLSLNQFADAIATYQTALTVSPDHPDVLHNLAIAQERQTNPAPFYQESATKFFQGRQYGLATSQYERLLELLTQQQIASQPIPSQVDWYVQLSQCYQETGQAAQAIATLQLGLQHYSDRDYSDRDYLHLEQLHYELITQLIRIGRTETAIAQAHQACQQCPDSYTLKLLNALLLPIIYDTPDEMTTYRQRYLSHLRQLSQELSQADLLNNPTFRQAALLAIQRLGSFYITYQAQDMLEPQRLYGQLVQQIMAAHYPEWMQPRSMPVVQGKIRVGFLSHYLHSYSGTLWLTGWLRYCDRQQFQIYCYYTGDAPDAVTEIFQAHSDFFHPISNDLEAVCRQVLADDLHILIFPEIGMDAPTIAQAGLRLAPIQCTAWGHPVTSGLSTIDYYLSSVLMEPENAQSHYSETLITLPNLGIAYPKPPLPALSKTCADWGLKEDAIIYLCIQAPFKYLPQHDYLFTEIALQVSNAQFVFIRADVLKPRISRAFNQVGLNYEDYCVFLPAQPRNDYLMLNLLADVYLDTLGFTGGNTTFDAIACGLPVVTCPGEFMRGRLSYGILQLLGCLETIANTEAEYIRLAIRLGQDADWRKEIAQRIQQNSDRVFDDQTAIPALEAFFQSTIQPNQAYNDLQ
jgi:predicted O-linked N-acetylglucosamine transferase (SPINDLY family)